MSCRRPFFIDYHGVPETYLCVGSSITHTWHPISQQSWIFQFEFDIEISEILLKLAGNSNLVTLSSWRQTHICLLLTLRKLAGNLNLSTFYACIGIKREWLLPIFVIGGKFNFLYLLLQNSRWLQNWFEKFPGWSKKSKYLLKLVTGRTQTTKAKSFFATCILHTKHCVRFLSRLAYSLCLGLFNCTVHTIEAEARALSLWKMFDSLTGNPSLKPRWVLWLWLKGLKLRYRASV